MSEAIKVIVVVFFLFSLFYLKMYVLLNDYVLNIDSHKYFFSLDSFFFCFFSFTQDKTHIHFRWCSKKNEMCFDTSWHICKKTHECMKLKGQKKERKLCVIKFTTIHDRVCASLKKSP
jgi:hypothetical protein